MSQYDVNLNFLFVFHEMLLNYFLVVHLNNIFMYQKNLNNFLNEEFVSCNI